MHTAPGFSMVIRQLVSHYHPSLVVKLQSLNCMLILLLKYGKLLTSHISPALAPTYYSEVFPCKMTAATSQGWLPFMSIAT